MGAPPAYAANLTVTTDADSGPGSLRAAVAAAHPGDTVTFASNLILVPIKLTSGEILIDKDLTIRGNGSAFTTIRREAGSPDFRIFNIAGAGVDVTIDSVTVQVAGPPPVPVSGRSLSPALS